MEKEKLFAELGQLYEHREGAIQQVNWANEQIRQKRLQLNEILKGENASHASEQLRGAEDECNGG